MRFTVRIEGRVRVIAVPHHGVCGYIEGCRCNACTTAEVLRRSYHRQISLGQISLGRLDRADPAVRQAVLALRSKQALSASRSGRR